MKAENTEPKFTDKSGSKDELNGKEMTEGSGFRSATEGYTLETTEKRHENGEFATATGKSYEVLDNNPNYKLYVHGYQSENTDRPSVPNETPASGGRADIPLSKEEAEKLKRESILWDGRIRPTAKKNNGVINRRDDKALENYLNILKSDGAGRYGAGGAYEFLATEIYGYAYEQGKHYVYIKDVKNRFRLSKEAQDAGYRISNIDLTNLIPGTGYDEKTDTIEGYVSSQLQNGVYDMRYTVTVTKPDNTTSTYSFANLKAGWMGWQDTTPPTIEGSSTVVKIGDTLSHDLKYLDNPGMLKDDRANYQYTKVVRDPQTNESREEDNGGRVNAGSQTGENYVKGAYFTAQDGSRIRTMNGPQTVTAHTTLNGVYTGRETPITDVVPGLSYDPKTGLITGTATEAGIFTMAAQAKDYNNGTNAKNGDWNAYGQETHENITIAVAPKITVSNVEAYSTSLPVTISNGANTAEITTPDGKITKMAVKNGKWVVVEGTTNPAVTIGAELGEASTTGNSTFNLSVTSDATQYAGVDNIVAKATTDKVKANLQREVVTVRDVDGQTHTATFNRATGKFQLPDNEAYVVTDNADGTTTLKERRVYTDLKANGDIDYIVYEFTRTWTSHSDATNLVDKVEEIRKNGEVKAVGDVTRTVTTVPKDQTATADGVIVTVTYDSVTGTWSASDGSKVKATPSNAGWNIETSSGFKGYVTYRSATGVDVSSIQNAKPTGSSTDYEGKKHQVVDLLKSPKANVGFTDIIDDKSTDDQSETITTKLTVTAPDGTKKVFDAAQAEETAFIQAQRTQAEKNKLASEAVKAEQDAKNELARLQELIDRQIQYNADAQSSLDNLRLRTISITAKELAEGRLNDGKAKLVELEKELAAKQGELPGVSAKVVETRAAALAAEQAVETAREALKVASKKNLENAELTAYKLSQVGEYTVTVRAVDSNGMVTTPTVGGDDSGEVTEDAVAETTYHITVPLVKAPVVVNHYKDGTLDKLAPSEDKGKFPIDDPYTTEPATIPPKTEVEDTPEKTITRVITYTLKEMPSDKDGTVPEEGKVINYYYVEHVETTEVAKKAPVLVNYYIENTTTKLAPSDDQGQKEIGSKYTSETKVIEPVVEKQDLPDRVVTKTTKYELVKVPEDKEGTVLVEGKVVNYYYKPVVTTETVMKKAPVLVNYYIENTTTKLAPSDDQGQKEIGSKYTSETKSIPPVVEKQDLPDRVVTKTTKYELVKVPEDKEGIVPVEGKVVNYYYKPVVTTETVMKKAPVLVNYYIENTTTKLAPSDDQGQKEIGSKYTSETKVIPPVVEKQDLPDRVVTKTTKYELVKVPEDKEGTVLVEGKVVNYYYKPVVTTETVMKKAPVLVNYYIENTTTKLAPSDDQGQKEIGSKYTSETKSIPPVVEKQDLPDRVVTKTTKYELVKVPEDKEGIVPVEGKVVNYYYKPVVTTETVMKKAPVLVNYYIENTTTKLAPSDDQGQKEIGSKYTSETKVIEPVVEKQDLLDRVVTKTTKYELVKVPEDKEGTVPVEGKVVNYYYKPVVTTETVMKKAPLTVNYYKEGTTEKLNPSENHDGKEIGSNYSTEPKVIKPKVEKIVKDGNVITKTTKYELVKVPEDKDGKIPEGGKVVNYYYREVVEEVGKPNEAPKIEIPEYNEPVGTVPNDAPKVEIPEYNEPIGIPGTPEVHEKPEFNGGVTPLDPPVVEIPEYKEPIGSVPNDAPKVEIPDFNFGVPGIPEVHEKPEFKGGVVPLDPPVLEKPEAKIPDVKTSVPEKPVPPTVPMTPVVPQTPEKTVSPKPVETPPVQEPVVIKPVYNVEKPTPLKEAALPNTAGGNNMSLSALGALTLSFVLGLAFRKRKED